ncbi:aldo/keto reductase [Gymnodinialimonas ulvae]|uniref:aldo/keto reductase n=1 Tax=Gymnodinialimonas ulvae TaxID=3126504 RepID=UPI0030B0167F
MRPPGSRGGSRRAILKRADASLKRLRVDAVDLYFVHGWDNETDVSETLGALDDLRRAGKIHHIGWSNVTGWQLERICRTAEANGLPMPCALQPQVSLLERGIELEILPCALANNIGLTPWSPLGGGWLTGKYTANERPTSATRLGEDPNRGVEAYDNRNTERTHSVPEVAAELAEWHERPMSHIALAWLADRPGVASLLLGARNVEQLADNLDAASLALKDDDLNALTEASDTILPDYPYGFLRDWSEVAHRDRLGRS